MKVSKVALAAATILSGSAMLAGTPALAQGSGARTGQPQAQGGQPAQAGQAAQAPQRNYNLSRAERTALQPLLAANQAQNWTAIQAALPAARAAAQGADAKYLVSRVELALALNQNNPQAQIAAIDAILASGAAPADEIPRLLNVQAERYFSANNFAAAERNYVRLQQLTPNDPRITQNLSVVRQRMGNTSGAYDLLVQTIRTQEAAGQRVEETQYRRAFALAYEARQLAPAMEFARKLVQNYPTSENWRNALTVYRQLGNVDGTLYLDTMRLARAANALRGESDYGTFARSLDQAGLPGETKAVTDAGVAAGALRTSDAFVGQLLGSANRRIAEDRTGLPAQITQARGAANGRLARAVGDALYGYGRYQEAADLYRVALSKGGEDANLINTRLGASLALAGQRAEAEAAFRAVTGQRAELAQLWLAWLARRTS